MAKHEVWQGGQGGGEQACTDVEVVLRMASVFRSTMPAGLAYVSFTIY